MPRLIPNRVVLKHRKHDCAASLSSPRIPSRPLYGEQSTHQRRLIPSVESFHMLQIVSRIPDIKCPWVVKIRSGNVKMPNFIVSI